MIPRFIVFLVGNLVGKKMLTINFYLSSKENKKGERQIILRIRSHGFDLGLPHRVKKDDWVQKDQRLRKSAPLREQKNLYLQCLETELKHLHIECIQKNEPFDKNLILKRIALLNPSKSISVLALFEKFIAYKAPLNASLASYKSTLEYLKEFNARHRVLSFADMTYKTFEALRFFFGSKDLSQSTIAGKFRDIKAFLRWCEEIEEIRVQQGYKKFKVRWEEVNHLALNINELRAIEQADFSSDARLNNARNLFLLQCYTGLRRSDLKQLVEKVSEMRPDEKGNYSIFLTQQKTKDVVYVPLITPALAILKGELHDISDQRYNEYIKEVCKCAGLIQNFTLKRHRGNKVEQDTREMYEHITSHTARRTFATLAIHYYKISEVDAMKLTGHRTINAFRAYVKQSLFTQTSNEWVEAWDRKNKSKK